MHEIYLELRPEDIAYVKFIIESYETIGIIRTVDRKKAVIVFLVVEDFLPVARGLVAALHDEIQLSEIPRPLEVGDDWLMNELGTETTEDR